MTVALSLKARPFTGYVTEDESGKELIQCSRKVAGFYDKSDSEKYGNVIERRNMSRLTGKSRFPALTVNQGNEPRWCRSCPKAQPQPAWRHRPSCRLAKSGGPYSCFLITIYF